jgi:hypothetical protein
LPSGVPLELPETPLPGFPGAFFAGAGSLSTFKSASGCPIEIFGVLNPASLCSFVDTEVGLGKTGWLSTGKTETPVVSMACAAMTVLGVAVVATFGLARSSGCACVGSQEGRIPVDRRWV